MGVSGMYIHMNTPDVKAALRSKDQEIRSLTRSAKEQQKTIDKLRKVNEKLDKPKKPRGLNEYNLIMREVLLRPEVTAIANPHERMREANKIRKREQLEKASSSTDKPASTDTIAEAK